MVCRELVEAVTAYLDGSMPTEDRARFDAHLALCDGCQRYLEQIRETIRLTGTLDPGAIPDDQRSALQAVFRSWAASA